MKKLLPLIFAAAIGSGFPHLALAQDFQDAFEPISSRILSDPLYLPLQGQVYGATAYTFTRPSYDVLNYNQTIERDTVKGNDNTFTQTVEYGITNDLALRITDSYEFNTTNSTSPSTGKTTSDSDRGFVDPTVAATYRVLDQANNYPVDVDLTSSYTPNAIEAKTGNDGSVASGRQEVAGLTAGVGREMKMFSIQATANATYEGTESYQSLPNDQYHTVKDSWEYIFGLNSETRLTDRFSINLNTGYTLGTHADTEDLNTLASSVSLPANVWSYTAALNYQIIPNRLVAALTYTYDYYSHSKSLYVTTTSDTMDTNHDANVYGARLLYVF